MSRQPVLGNRLPGRRARHELARARADAGIAVERPHPDADGVGVAEVAAEDRRAAVAAEPLLPPAGVRLPRAQAVLARDDPERAVRRMGVRRRGHARTALAALAMAVAGDTDGRGHLVADRAARA